MVIKVFIYIRFPKCKIIYYLSILSYVNGLQRHLTYVRKVQPLKKKYSNVFL